MLILGIVLACTLYSTVQPHNIEVREIYPVYVRNGGAVKGNIDLVEPTYAGYSFDANSVSGETK